MLKIKPNNHGHKSKHWHYFFDIVIKFSGVKRIVDELFKGWMCFFLVVYIHVEFYTHNIVVSYTTCGRRVIGISGSLIWSKILMELIFKPCGEFRWSPEGPVSQIHSSHLHSGSPGIFSDLLRSVQMLKSAMGCGKQWEATPPIYP